MSALAIDPGVKIRYARGDSAFLTVRLIASWNREDVNYAKMSSSSGPKDYIWNDVYSLFQRNPKIDRVVMVRASGPPFFLLEAEHAWFDVTGKQIVKEKE